MFCLKVCLPRLLGGIKVSKMLSLAIDCYRSGPAFCLLWLCVAKRFSVLAVERCRCASKVACSVICFVSVDVVNKLWKIAMMNSKRNPVRVGKRSIVLKHNVSTLVHGSNWLAWIRLSVNQSSNWVVCKARKIKTAHAVAPSLQWSGKWRLSVPALGRCAIV